MGKRIISQRRGRGTSRYKSPSHRFVAQASHVKKHDGMLNGVVLDFIKCAGHTSPLMRVRYDNGDEAITIAPAGIRIGQPIVSGGFSPSSGTTSVLKDIPEGTLIYNIEAQPGDGGKFVRSSGVAARVVAKFNDKVVVLMPSKKQKEFSPMCRAAIGVVAGSGRLEKPFVKAGSKFYKMRAKNKLWPRSEGVKMNAVDHPFGNSRSSKKGRPTIARTNAPPGAKVGKIRPRRTGRKAGKASRKF